MQRNELTAGGGRPGRPVTPLGWHEPFPADAAGMESDLASPCGRNLHAVDRSWTADPAAQWLGWILLAPAPARTMGEAVGDPADFDPALDRCRRYARCWGFGGVRVHYVLPRRVHDVEQLLRDESGPHGAADGGGMLRILFESCGMVVAAWGSYPQPAARALTDAARLAAVTHRRRLHCLGQLADGSPRAPLFAPRAAGPEIYLNPEGATR